MIRLLVSLVAAVALLLALQPAAAPARIVLNKSIAGVKLQASPAAVRKVLGKPTAKPRRQTWTNAYYQRSGVYEFWAYSRKGLWL